MDTRHYGAYGYRVASTIAIARTGFCGTIGEADLSWYLLGKRFYVPWLRRFLSPDSFSPFGTGGLSRYAYCVGDPVNRIDPSGNASFGWLGKLLGQMRGTIATASRTAAQTTPGAALATISRTAEVVSVSVSIGAAIAAGVDDERTAGILGWIAAGSAALAGLGVAAHAMAKGHSDSKATDRLDHYGKKWKQTGHVQKDGYTKTTYTSPDGRRQIKHYIGNAAVEKKIPERAVRAKPGGEIYGIRPDWQIYESPSGGKNYVLDMVNTDSFTAYAIDLIADQKEAWDVNILTGVHGAADGRNFSPKGLWSRVDVRRFGDPRIERNSHRGLDRYRSVLNGPINITNIHGKSVQEFLSLTNQQAHTVHMACYSAADWHLMEQCNVTTARIYST